MDYDLVGDSDRVNLAKGLQTFIDDSVILVLEWDYWFHNENRFSGGLVQRHHLVNPRERGFVTPRARHCDHPIMGACPILFYKDFVRSIIHRKPRRAMVLVSGFGRPRRFLILFDLG